MLTGKRALVTGSTSGIGLAMAKALAGAGADVMLNGFGDADEIETTRKSLETDYGVTAHYNGADLSKPDEIEAIMKDAEAKFGGIDILVSNNCGNVRLLQNRIGSSNSWIGLDVRNDGGRVEAGIRCEIRQGDHLVLSRRARRGGSYLCSNDPRISVGLGERTDNCDITVFWFGGLVEVFEDLSVRRYHTLKRGEGIPPR